MEPSRKSGYKNRKKLLSCLFFGEGGKEKNFIIKLLSLEKFLFHTAAWYITPDSSSGGDALTIVNQCAKLSKNYDLAICLIDMDRLKKDYPKNWKKIQIQIESIDPKIKVVWQIDNLEDEFQRVINNPKLKKSEINTRAKQNIDKFINTDFWHRIISKFKEAEGQAKTTKT